MGDDTMLTTYDNPFNPFTDFISWWKYDLLLGHDTCGLLARSAGYDPNVSDEVNEKYIDSAMNDIVELEPEIYRIVRAKDYKEVLVTV